jgi:hypothetical protein
MKSLSAAGKFDPNTGAPFHIHVQDIEIAKRAESNKRPAKKKTTAEKMVAKRKTPK